MLRYSHRVLRGAGRRAACDLCRPAAREATPAFASSLRIPHTPSQVRAAFPEQLRQRASSFACSGLSRSKATQTRAFSAEGGKFGEEKDPAAAAAADGGTIEEKTEEQEGGESEDEVNKEVEMLKAEVSEKTALAKDLNDKLLLTLADMENLRERTRRQSEAASKFAIQGFCKDLLDVADNLGRAVATVEIDADADEAKVKAMLSSLHEGVLMVEKQLASTFGKHGVEKFDPLGDEFNPNSHMALFNVPDGNKEPGTVATVMKPGYKLHDRVIRAAEVGVYQSP